MAVLKVKGIMKFSISSHENMMIVIDGKKYYNYFMDEKTVRKIILGYLFITKQ